MKKLTDAEFSTVYNKLLRLFGRTNTKEVTMDIYRMRAATTLTSELDRLWIYLYAMNTWDNTNIDNNYITEDQMLAIVHKVQTIKL